VSVLSKLSEAERPRFIEQVLEAYAGGARIADSAREIGVHEKTLHRFLRKHDPKGWLIAQEARLMIELEDLSERGTDRSRNSWDYRYARLQRNRPH
jgi:hypothetical protein